MGAPIHGITGLIYVSGTELKGANAWSIDSTVDAAEAPEFGDTWKKHVAGLLTWSGSLSAWEQTDQKILFTAATSGASVALLIYPVRGTLGDYYSGNAIFVYRNNFVCLSGALFWDRHYRPGSDATAFPLTLE